MNYIKLSKLGIEYKKDKEKNFDYITIIFKPVSDEHDRPIEEIGSVSEENLSKNIQEYDTVGVCKEFIDKSSPLNVNPTIPEGKSDEYRVENPKSEQLSNKYKDILKYYEKLTYESDKSINNINTLFIFNNYINKDKYDFPFKTIYEIEKAKERKILKERKEKIRLEKKSSQLSINKRKYSTYNQNIEKRLFSTSSCNLLGKSLDRVKGEDKGEGKITGVYEKVLNQSSVCDGDIEDKSDKKTSKIIMENQMFNIIKDILSNSPINDETQLKIEELIFNGFKEFLEDSDNIINILGGFNSKLLSNQEFRVFIHNTMDNIKILLKELKTSLKKKISKNKTKKTRDHITLFEIILSNLNIKDLISIIIMTFFNIITYNMVKKEDSTGDPFFQTNLVNLSINMGKNIVEFYIRNLYKKASLNDIKLTDFKDKLKGDLSHKTIDDVEFLVYIGSGLIQIMKEGGLVEDKIVKIDTKKNQSLITVSEEVLKICGKDLVNKAIAIPLNLPMIVEPKDYKNLNKLSDGGYLLNNKEIIQPLFTENLLQTEKSSILKENKILECINGIMKIPFKINTKLLDYI